MSDIQNEIRTEILEWDKDVFDEFRNHFESEIEYLIFALSNSWNKVIEYDKFINGNIQKALFLAFFLNTIRDIVVSTKLLINGYLVPSGSLMRQCFESIAMGILCSRSDQEYYCRIYKNNYLASNAVKDLMHNHEIFQVNNEAMKIFNTRRGFYNNYSHSSLFSVASYHSFQEISGYYLGGHFDDAKIKLYSHEFKTRIALADKIQGIFNSALEHAVW